MSNQSMVEPINPTKFEASFTFDRGAVDLILRGLGKLPAEESMHIMIALRDGYEQQLFLAQREFEQQQRKLAEEAEQKRKFDEFVASEQINQTGESNAVMPIR